SFSATSVARHRACQHSPSSEGKVIWSERVWDIHKKLHAIALIFSANKFIDTSLIRGYFNISRSLG
ncbi:hypothetical protein, partial [Desulfobacula sp.]|uniref:hypothetical protein n=1 Tax=Desulfobacula sp. TaxID=2593537 RepID=UPI002624DA2B